MPVSSGDIKAIKTLLVSPSNINVDAKNGKGLRPLMLAASSGQADIVSELLKANASLII